VRLWLYKIREKKQLTQIQVAKACGIKRTYYNMIERGSRRPSVDVAMKIADSLEFDWTLFFTENSNNTTHKIRTHSL